MFGSESKPRSDRNGGRGARRPDQYQRDYDGEAEVVTFDVSVSSPPAALVAAGQPPRAARPINDRLRDGSAMCQGRSPTYGGRSGRDVGSASQPPARPVGVAAGRSNPHQARLAHADVRSGYGGADRPGRPRELSRCAAARPGSRLGPAQQCRGVCPDPGDAASGRWLRVRRCGASSPSGRVPLAPPAFRAALHERADDAGLLPPWTSWWDEASAAVLFPNAEVRAQIEREQQQLPVSYFEGSLPAPHGWDERRAGYPAFGDTYATERDEATQRGWPVSTLRPAGRLHMLIDPDQTVTALVELIGRLGFGSSAA